MKIFSLDPGAERLGWAVITDDPSYVASGIIATPRLPGEDYQPYRIRLIERVQGLALSLLNQYNPDLLVAEILPARGMNNMSQAYLALSAVTAFQTMAACLFLPSYQRSAITVKKDVTGNSKATKVGVRNGVISMLPELASRKSQWVKIFDELDAIAVGLSYAVGKK